MIILAIPILIVSQGDIIVTHTDTGIDTAARFITIGTAMVGAGIITDIEESSV